MFADILHLFINTDPIDRKKAARAMEDFYVFCGQEKPEIVFVDGPKDLAEKFRPDEVGFSFFDHNTIAHFVTKRGSSLHDSIKDDISSIFWPYSRIGKMDRKFVGSSALLIPEDHLYAHREGGEREREKEFDGHEAFTWHRFASKVWDNSLLTINCVGRSYILDRAAVVKYNERGLHCEDGPALVFRDGSEFHFWNSASFAKKPEDMTLEDIHKHPSQHVAIAYAGVDRYLSMCKDWKIDVKNRFKKFFLFSEMIIPSEEGLDKWNRRSYGWMYDNDKDNCERKPYEVKCSRKEVNKESVILFEHKYGIHTLPHSWRFDNYNTWIKSKGGKLIFEKKDLELLETLDIVRMVNSFHKFTISYYNKEFKLEVPRDGLSHGPVRRDAAPLWFRAKMLLGQDAFYEEDTHFVEFKNGELNYKAKKKEYRIDNSLFGGNQQVPQVWFDICLTSDSWEGLLEKWAKLAFELKMFSRN